MRKLDETQLTLLDDLDIHILEHQEIWLGSGLKKHELQLVRVSVGCHSWCLLDELPLCSREDVIQTVPEEDLAILDHHGPQQICFADAGIQNLCCCEMGKAPDTSRLKNPEAHPRHHQFTNDNSKACLSW